MLPESDLASLPKLSMDETPVPPAVLEQVEALKAEGKKVTAKIPHAEYVKLMALPHEERLAYALRVMARQDAKAKTEARLLAKRKQRRATAKRNRKQGRKRRSSK